MGINAGDLDREFTIQSPTGLGPTYEPVETGVWGSRRLASGGEVLRSITPEATVTHVVTMRYREDLRADWRLLEEDTQTALQITTFGDPDGRREQLQIFVVEAQ